MMRKHRVRALLAVCACLVAAAICTSCGSDAKKDGQAGAAKAGGVPKIVAVESAFDFGKVRQGDAVEHVFKIRNAGDGELKIEKARGS